MPAFARVRLSTYTNSGKVMLFYQSDADSKEDDFINIAVVNDDGTDFKTIFSGVIKQHEKANGIRIMPFQDNKRALLGDYVLECSPDIDHCEKVELVPIEYPWQVDTDPHTTHRWSEIIIAPDNEHMSWTMLRTDVGAANGLGILKREGGKYIIENPQIISSFDSFKADEANPGYLIPQVMRGGEVKQFVRGGTAISLVGAKDGATPDSVVQDLLTGEVTQITKTPGYDETTMFSPDERLGIVMSTRGSKKTDPAIFGLMPRPHSLVTTGGLSLVLYMYAVAGVRSFRRGNIGPVLIDIERSMNEAGYQGVLLHDPEEEWVYMSPISWHPGGKKAMWMELVRGSFGTEGGLQTRVRKVALHDYRPQAPVAIQRTPDDIPYGIKNISGRLDQLFAFDSSIEGRIAGKHSGYVEVKTQGRDLLRGIAGSSKATYANFSDDGKTFYNGIESVVNSFMSDNVYEADLDMVGEQQGEMKLRATFSQVSFELPPKLLFDEAEDDKPKSYGYATYNGVTLRIEDLEE
jgi:hypothetical protein